MRRPCHAGPPSLRTGAGARSAATLPMMEVMRVGARRMVVGCLVAAFGAMGARRPRNAAVTPRIVGGATGPDHRSTPGRWRSSNESAPERLHRPVLRRRHRRRAARHHGRALPRRRGAERRADPGTTRDVVGGPDRPRRQPSARRGPARPDRHVGRDARVQLRLEQPRPLGRGARDAHPAGTRPLRAVRAAGGARRPPAT